MAPISMTPAAAGTPLRARRFAKGRLFLILSAAALAALLTNVCCFAKVRVKPFKKPRIRPGMLPEPTFRIGDVVRLKVPAQLSNDGRGYYNEGAATDVPDHQRDLRADRKRTERRRKFVEGGLEGQVVGVIKAAHWENRPNHIKGNRRPLIMVNFENDRVPLDVFEENDLELLDRTLADERKKMEKAGKFISYWKEGVTPDTTWWDYTGGWGKSE
mmetsp:Transcript_137004/g.347088  ORF Transcript_137004/g.347088 Transcript_137004/m.347088 type:complete len:215 (+) Transcript_137004:114-758(+)